MLEQEENKKKKNFRFSILLFRMSFVFWSIFTRKTYAISNIKFNFMLCFLITKLYKNIIKSYEKII